MATLGWRQNRGNSRGKGSNLDAFARPPPFTGFPEIRPDAERRAAQGVWKSEAMNLKPISMSPKPTTMSLKLRISQKLPLFIVGALLAYTVEF